MLRLIFRNRQIGRLRRRPKLCEIFNYRQTLRDRLYLPFSKESRIQANQNIVVCIAYSFHFEIEFK